MGSEWIECTLGDYLTFKNGKSSPEREAAAEKPVYGANGVIGFSDQVNTQSQSLVIGRVGTYCGSVYHTSSDCWVTDNAISCVPKISGESEFWYFKLLALHLNSHRTGSGQPLLNQGILNSISTGIPKEHSVRYSIGKFLMDFDNKIALNRQINTTLESMAQALFKSWFVDFDPVIDNALAAGNEIPDELAARAVRRKALHQQTSKTTNKTANETTEATDAASVEQALPGTGLSDQRLPPEIQQLFPDRFVLTEEMGWVPEGWGIESLDRIANYQNGLALQKFRPEDENDFLPVVKIAQLKKGYADGEEKASPNIKPECIIDDGDVVFSWSGSLMVDVWCGGRAALNQHLFKVTSDEYPKWFFLHFTLHHLAEFQRIAADKAVTMGHIKREHLSQAKCSVPGMDFMEKLSPFFEPLLNKSVLSRLENRALVNLRDSLLPKLLSGQITIPDAEQQLAEVL